MSNFTEPFPAGADDARIPDSLRELVDAELNDGETIRWIDQPIPYYFSAGSSIAFGFGIYITIFPIGLLCEAVFDPPSDNILYALIGILMLMGLPFLLVPLWTRQKTKRTVYAVTNYRAIIVQGGFSVFNVTSYYPPDISHLFRKQKANGVGKLCFRETNWGSILLIRQGFFNIRNVQEVERLLQELKGTKER